MWRYTVSLGHIGGTRIRLHASAAVTVVVLTSALALALLPVTTPGVAPGWYWAAGLVVSVGFLACLLLHELAHARTARHYGVDTDHITLWLLGGVAALKAEPPHPKADAVIAAAGPATSAVLGAACWTTALVISPTVPPAALSTLLWLGAANLTLAAVTLLPGAPLDGGRIIRALAWVSSRDRHRAAVLACRCGQVIGSALLAGGAVIVIVYGQFVGIWLSLLGWFLIGAATAEHAHADASASLGDLPVRAVMTTTSTAAPGWWTVEAFLRQHDIHPETDRTDLPVVAFDGSALGLVRPVDLTRLPPERRSRTRVADVSRRPPSVGIVAADAPARTVLSRHGTTAIAAPLLVAHGTALVGILTARDLRRLATPTSPTS